MPAFQPNFVRGIALLEALKGALAAIAGAALLRLDNHHVPAIVARLIRFYHVDPASRYPRVFMEAAGRVTATDLAVLAAVAFGYAGIRTIEAYGLWHTRPWAEWFALGSTCFYLPVELYELSQRVTWLTAGVLIVNVAIAAYLTHALRHDDRWSRLFSRPPAPDARTNPASVHPI